MFSHGPPRLPSRCRPPLSRMPFLHPVLFHFVPAAAPNAANIADGGVPAPNGQPVRRDPVSRVSRPRARPSARVSAGAVRAPDCARARETPKSGRTSPGRFSRVFSRRREPGRKAAPGRPLPSSRLIWARHFGSQPDLGILFDKSEQTGLPTRFHCRTGNPLGNGIFARLGLCIGGAGAPRCLDGT